MNRTAELARIFGIDFFSVLNRGSQYRVESMMARLAHSQNYLLVSPSRMQVGARKPLSCTLEDTPLRNYLLVSPSRMQVGAS